MWVAPSAVPWHILTAYHTPAAYAGAEERWCTGPCSVTPEWGCTEELCSVGPLLWLLPVSVDSSKGALCMSFVAHQNSTRDCAQFLGVCPGPKDWLLQQQ